MFDIIPFFLFAFITLFHVYMGFGGPLNYEAVLPKIGNEDMPFHASFCFPIAGLLTLSTISFGFQVGILPNSILGTFNSTWLLITAASLVFRGCFGFIVFHALNKVIDDTAFKTWDLRIYSPLTLYLGIASFKALGLI